MGESVVLVANVTQLNSRSDWFSDAARPAAENVGPYVIVVDNLYDDPDNIRRQALTKEFYQYSPPLAEHVGTEIASDPLYQTISGRWMSTCLHTFRGKRIDKPILGYRYVPDVLRSRFEQIVGGHISMQEWQRGGDFWNGVFHLKDAAHNEGFIHHHYKAGDVETVGWSGLVYLSPDGDVGSGTSIWLHKPTGLCVGGFGSQFSRADRDYEIAYNVPYRYNRLVLFRENVLHRGEAGFGSGVDARLTQTFFFRLTIG